MTRSNQPPNDDTPDRLDDRDAAVERLLDSLSGQSAPPADLDPEDAESVRVQQKIDASLRRSFAPPAPPAELMARLSEAEAETSPTVKLPAKAPGRLNLPNWAVAAMLLIGLGPWGYKAYHWITHEESRYGEVNVVAMYTQAVNSGFEPDWFCEDEKRFADTFAERQGTGVWLRPLPEGVQMAGLAYLRGLSPQATSVMARADGQPVLVVVDRQGEIPSRLLEPLAGSDARVFVEERDGLTLVEVTPFDEPRVAPSLYQRDPPSEPTGRVPGSR